LQNRGKLRLLIKRRTLAIWEETKLLIKRGGLSFLERKLRLLRLKRNIGSKVDSYNRGILSYKERRLLLKYRGEQLLLKKRGNLILLY